MNPLVYIYSLMIWDLQKWVNEMKRVYCEIHMFDLHQNIYVVDPTVGTKEQIAITTLEELPEVISAICDAKKVLAYSKKHYSWNNIEVEVLK